MSKLKKATLPTDKEARRACGDMAARTDATMHELEQWIISMGGRELTQEEIASRSIKAAGASHIRHECPIDAVLASSAPSPCGTTAWEK